MIAPLTFQGTKQTEQLLAQHFTLSSSAHATAKPGALALVETGETLTLSSILGTENFSKPVLLQNFKQRYDTLCARLASIYKIGTWLFDAEGHTLLGDQPVKLAEKEVLILKTLIQEPGGLSRDALLKRIWGHDETIETRTVESHIYGLRQKLEPNPQNPCLLISTTQGYKIPVESVDKIL